MPGSKMRQGTLRSLCDRFSAESRGLEVEAARARDPLIKSALEEAANVLIALAFSFEQCAELGHDGPIDALSDATASWLAVEEVAGTRYTVGDVAEAVVRAGREDIDPDHN